jgi:hypothetical protein
MGHPGGCGTMTLPTIKLSRGWGTPAAISLKSSGGYGREAAPPPAAKEDRLLGWKGATFLLESPSNWESGRILCCGTLDQGASAAINEDADRNRAP